MGCSLGISRDPAISHPPGKPGTAKKSEPQNAHPHHAGKIFCLICTDDSRLFTGGEDGFVLEWDLKSLCPVGSFSGHTDAVLCLAADLSIYGLFSGSRDTSICYWDIYSSAPGNPNRLLPQKPRPEKLKLLGHAHAVSALGVAKGNYLYSGSTNKLIQEWDAITGRKLRSIVCGSEDNDPIRSISIIGQSLFVASLHGNVWGVDLIAGQVMRKYKVDSNMVNVMAVNFGRLFIATSSGKVLDFKVETEQINGETEVSESAVTSLCVGKGSMFVATSNSDLYEVSIANGKRVRKMNTDDVAVLCLGLSNDCLYSGGRNGEVHEWSLEKRDQERPGRMYRLKQEEVGKLEYFANVVNL